MDTLIYKVKPILGNTVANVYTQGKFIKVYLIKAQREVGKSIIDFTDNVGVTEKIITDGAGEFIGWNTELLNTLGGRTCSYRIRNKVGTTKNHAAEREIGFLSKLWIRQMTKKVTLKRLCDFGIVYEAELLSLMSKGKGKMCWIQRYYRSNNGDW